jgi:hypothetical protein
MSLITIKKSHIESELLVLKSKLESEGIKCYLKNEFTTQIMNYLPSFEVELQVSDLDLERVKEIICEMEGE